jgi:CheY-like chemotaxis protein
MKTIILIEDDDGIRDVFSLGLSAYNVLMYGNGDVIYRNETLVPDLFVLDKNISGSDGTDLIRFIKKSERYKHVPTLLLSAAVDIAHIANEAGADDFISKPFSLSRLREIVAKYAL